MKKETVTKKNNNGSYTTTTTISKTPEDEFVNETVMKPVNSDYRKLRHKYHKGYGKTVSFTTNDPRITRPFAYGMCGIFFAIGIISLLSRNWFFGIIFTSIALFSFFKSKQDIDAIAEKLESQGQDVTIDTEEEKEELKKEVTETLKNTFDDITSTTFTKEHFNWFAKTTIPIYCFIAIATTLFITIFVNIILGLAVLGIFTIIGIFYYHIVSKICKH